VHLSDLKPFRALPPADRARVDEASRMVSVPLDAVLFRPGQPAAFLWAVAAGRIALLRNGPRGHQLALEVFAPGDVFGAVVALQQDTYPATAIAATASDLWMLPAPEVRELAERHPEFKLAIFDLAARRLQRAHERLFMMASQSLEQRLARAVLALARAFGRRDGTTLSVSVAQRELAMTVGAAIESVSRIVSRWHKAGLVVPARGRLTIVAPDELARVAGEEAPLD
jgi:CRP-like cAMP-binding protein